MTKSATRYRKVSYRTQQRLVDDMMLTHVVDSEDMDHMYEMLGIKRRRFESFLVETGEGCYVRVYGCTRAYYLLSGEMYQITNPYTIG